MDEKYSKSMSHPFLKLNPIGPFSGLFNEIQFILVAQDITKLLEVNCEL